MELIHVVDIIGRLIKEIKDQYVEYLTEQNIDLRSVYITMDTQGGYNLIIETPCVIDNIREDLRDILLGKLLDLFKTPDMFPWYTQNLCTQEIETYVYGYLQVINHMPDTYEPLLPIKDIIESKPNTPEVTNETLRNQIFQHGCLGMQIVGKMIIQFKQKYIQTLLNYECPVPLITVRAYTYSFIIDQGLNDSHAYALAKDLRVLLSQNIQSVINAPSSYSWCSAKKLDYIVQTGERILCYLAVDTPKSLDKHFKNYMCAFENYSDNMAKSQYPFPLTKATEHSELAEQIVTFARIQQQKQSSMSHDPYYVPRFCCKDQKTEILL